VRTGSGRPFAPNGRVFKEWVAGPAPARELWADLLNEAKRYVDGVLASTGVRSRCSATMFGVVPKREQEERQDHPETTVPSANGQPIESMPDGGARPDEEPKAMSP